MNFFPLSELIFKYDLNNNTEYVIIVALNIAKNIIGNGNLIVTILYIKRKKNKSATANILIIAIQFINFFIINSPINFVKNIITYNILVNH